MISGWRGSSILPAIESILVKSHDCLHKQKWQFIGKSYPVWSPFILNVMLRRPQQHNNVKAGMKPPIKLHPLGQCHCIACSGYLQNDYTLGGQSKLSLSVINIRPKGYRCGFYRTVYCFHSHRIWYLCTFIKNLLSFIQASVKVTLRTLPSSMVVY